MRLGHAGPEPEEPEEETTSGHFESDEPLIFDEDGIEITCYALPDYYYTQIYQPSPRSRYEDD